jgi:hypothetical protein
MYYSQLNNLSILRISSGKLAPFFTKKLIILIHHAILIRKSRPQASIPVSGNRPNDGPHHDSE